MAAFEPCNDMYDAKLKPRILHSLMNDHLPNELDPVPDYIDISRVVNVIRNFGLLSEKIPEQANSQLADDWGASVDAWVERLLLLVSSPRANKCWVGVCLLGVTCRECSSNRFSASYPVWLDKLLFHLQPASEYLSVKVASCASLSDLLTRLAGYPSVKRDGTTHAARLIQPVLELLNEDASEAVLEGAAGLLCTIINFFPSSIHHNYDSVEVAIVSKIISGQHSFNMLKKYAHCLAILPKSRGDEDSWFLMIQDILISINIHLNDVFQGLEQEAKNNEAKGLLVPPGRDPSAPLAGWMMSGEASYPTTRSKQLLVSIVPTLMLCCCKMLTNPYPVQVTVPVQPLMTLVHRVLMVNGSLSQSSLSFTMGMQREFICSELPILHSHSLDILAAIIKAARSRLIPYAGFIIRLLKEYFSRCALPALRIKVYSIVRILLISMGVGVALYISEEIISNALVDLDSVGRRSGNYSFGLDSETATTEALLQPGHKKRKHVDATGSLEGHQDGDSLETELPMNNSASLTSLKIAALEALETLLTVGGALKSERLRSNVDLHLINVATNAYDGKLVNEEESEFVPPSEPAWADLNLAALRALLASLLSQSHVCPRHLSEGLELFRKGKQEIGTKLAEFCAHALLALEVLMHPRFIPLGEFPTASQSSNHEGIRHQSSGNIYLGGQEINSPIPTPTGTVDPYPHDNLYDSWFASGDEIDAPPDYPSENLKIAKESSEADVQKAIKINEANNLLMDSSPSANIPEENKQVQEVPINVEMGRKGYNNTAETKESQEPISIDGFKVPVGTCTGSEIEFKNDVSGTGAFDSARNTVALKNDVLVTSEGGIEVESISATILVSGKGKGLAFGLSANEPSMDPHPASVDEDSASDTKRIDQGFFKLR